KIVYLVLYLLTEYSSGTSLGRAENLAARSDRANENTRSLALQQPRLRMQGARRKPCHPGWHEPALLVRCAYEKEIRLARAHLSRFSSPRENAERSRSRGIDG